MVMFSSDIPPTPPHVRVELWKPKCHQRGELLWNIFIFTFSGFAHELENILHYEHISKVGS